MMVPASEDVIIKSGVLSFVGVGRVLPEIPGAVVSVVVLSVEVDLSSVVLSPSSEVVVEDVLSVDADEPPSSLLAQEMIVKLIISEKIMSICLISFLIGLV